MAPSSVIIIRHGQAEHNVGKQHHLRDPPLARYGRMQCRILCRELKDSKVCPDFILVGPALRTLATALIATEGLVADMQSRFIVLPELQEVSHMPPGWPRALEENRAILQRDFQCARDPFENWDISETQRDSNDWLCKKNLFHATQVKERAAYVLNYLQKLDGQVLVVTHAIFAKELLRGQSELDYAITSQYRNCEARKYDLIQGRLVNEQVLNRGGHDPLLPVPRPQILPLKRAHLPGAQTIYERTSGRGRGREITTTCSAMQTG